MTFTSNDESIQLGNSRDWKLLVNEDRVVVKSTRSDVTETNKERWTVLSSALLNGGLRHFGPSLQIMNTKVPTGYDGFNPDPLELLRQFARKECQKDKDACTTNGDADETTVGLLTAASMETLRVATESATGTCGESFTVDVIVTAGISNARVSGADADVFNFVLDENKKKKKIGTINTIVLTNIPLDGSKALLQVCSVQIEAKARALFSLGIRCGKHLNQYATGTGTDNTVVVCPHSSTYKKSIVYAQQHTLAGELIGKAVLRATTEAVESNLEWSAGRFPYPRLAYYLRCYQKYLLQVILVGHRPIIPSKPKMPTPKPKGLVLLLGLLGFFSVAMFHLSFFETDNTCKLTTSFFSVPQPSVTAVGATLFADRFLGSVPLKIHPVMCVGKLISNLLKLIPEEYFQESNAAKGFVAGAILCISTLTIALGTAWLILTMPQAMMPALSYVQGGIGDSLICQSVSEGTQMSMYMLDFLLHVFILKGSLSLQLLCNVAYQMAYLLERGQLDKARNQLSWLCSRDPSNLQADELAGGTLESLSENLSDSVVAPLFYYVLLGPLGAFGFRAVNTLDSRVGFRGRHEWTGKFSARLDDILCLVAARLTAILLVVGAAICHPTEMRSMIRKGLSVAWRDSNQCDSPNAGWPMACFAGILDVRLEKRGQYSLNGPPGNGKPPRYQDIRHGHLIAQVAGILTFLLTVVTLAILQ
ncbi:MAG: hypothetical protein SGBAC_011807 [Bacillariaceae sp.]